MSSLAGATPHRSVDAFDVPTMDAERFQVRHFSHQIRKTDNAMSDVTAADMREQMRFYVRRAAEPAEPGEHLKALWRRASQRLGLPIARVQKYWYGLINSPPAHELEQSRLRMEFKSAVKSETLAARLIEITREIEELERAAGQSLGASPLGNIRQLENGKEHQKR